jgi:hypothetical protein
MIEIGAMGGSGRDVMKRLLQEMEAATGDSVDFARSITEADTEFGYWWRYQSAPDHPDEAITLMIHIAKVIADAEAHNTGKTYLVGRAASAVDAIYAFASDHPDARNAAINIMYDCPPAGQTGPPRGGANHSALTYGHRYRLFWDYWKCSATPCDHSSRCAALQLSSCPVKRSRPRQNSQTGHHWPW